MTLRIQLPDELSRYVHEQAAKRGYKDVSEYLTSLLEAEQQRRLEEDIDELLLQSVEGPFSDWTDQDIEDIKRAGQQIIERRKAR